MDRNHPDKPFARYADDAVAHCRSKEQAEILRESLDKRFKECRLELHPTKTRIVYCKDDDRTVSETLLELGQNPKYLGAKLGVTAILHTWGQNLLYHPHIHCVVPGGGLTSTGHWKNSRKKFFIPVKILILTF